MVTEPADQPTPTPAPTATPTPTPPPAPVTAPPQPSASELQAQQNAARVQQLLGEADAALAAGRYDAAIAHADEVLGLEPGHSRATATRAQAVTQRDLIVVKDVVVLLTAVVVAVNLAIDVLYAAIDPRPRSD